MDKPVETGGKTYTAQRRVLREARRSSGVRYDAWPVCPRCDEICDPRAFRCPSCRCRLYLD